MPLAADIPSKVSHPEPRVLSQFCHPEARALCGLRYPYRHHCLLQTCRPRQPSSRTSFFHDHLRHTAHPPPPSNPLSTRPSPATHVLSCRILLQQTKSPRRDHFPWRLLPTHFATIRIFFHSSAARSSKFMLRVHWGSPLWVRHSCQLLGAHRGQFVRPTAIDSFCCSSSRRTISAVSSNSLVKSFFVGGQLA